MSSDVRADQVAQGVKFLRHPDVQATPLSERVSFLERKGLTKAEIQAAIEATQATDGAATTAPATAMVAPVPMPVPAMAPHQLMRRARWPPSMRVLVAVSSLFGAASILSWLWTFAVNAGFFPWLKRSPPMIEQEKRNREAEEQEKEKEDELLRGIADVTTAVEAQTAELTKLCTTLEQKEQETWTKDALVAQISTSIAEQSTSAAIAELKAEVNTLKALLLSKQGSHVADQLVEASMPANTTCWQPTAPLTPMAAPLVAPPSKSERVVEALRLLGTQNSMEQLKAASGILTMYVKNLVENPEVPRYRRIAMGNANFKDKIEPLKHHDEFLKSIGFETSGMSMEWRWHTASKASGAFDDNLGILRAVLSALQALAKTNGSDGGILESLARARLKEYFDTKKNVAATAPGDATPAIKSPSTPERPDDFSLNDFMARLQQKTDPAGQDSVVTSTEPMKEPLAADLEEKPAAAIQKSNDPGPKYPESFADVMELVKRGETVPGIQEIEDKLSVDSELLLSSSQETTPGKPWEKHEAVSC